MIVVIDTYLPLSPAFEVMFCTNDCALNLIGIKVEIGYLLCTANAFIFVDFINAIILNIQVNQLNVISKHFKCSVLMLPCSTKLEP